MVQREKRQSGQTYEKYFRADSQTDLQTRFDDGSHFQTEQQHSGYLSFNPLMIVVFAAVMTFAMAYLEAGILTGITLAFKGKTSIHKMLCAVGYKALIQGIILLITALLFFVSWKVAIILYMIGSMAAQLFFIDGYRNAVEIHKDRRLYAFWLGEVLFFIAMVIILNFILTSMVTSVIGNYLNNYGGIVNGLMRELY